MIMNDNINIITTPHKNSAGYTKIMKSAQSSSSLNLTEGSAPSLWLFLAIV